MSSHISRESTMLFLRLSVTLLIGIAFSSPAFAAESLTEEMPAGHNAVVAVDFEELRASPFFAPALEWAKSHPAIGSQLRSLESSLEIDIGEDLESLVVVSDTPPLSKEMLANPMAAITAGAESTKGTMIFVRGEIDSGEIMARLGGEQEDASSYLRHGEMDLHQIDSRTLALVLGPTTYRDSARSRLENRSGPGAVFMNAFSSLGSGQGLYLMTVPEIEADAEEMTSSASFAAAVVTLAADVRLSVLMTMGSEEEAEESAGSFEALRAEAAANPLLSMFGLGPVIQNLSIRQQGMDVTVRTSMTNAQATNLMRQALQIMATSNQLQTPLGEDEPEEEPEADPVPRDGVDADFN